MMGRRGRKGEVIGVLKKGRGGVSMAVSPICT